MERLSAEELVADAGGSVIPDIGLILLVLLPKHLYPFKMQGGFRMKSQAQRVGRVS